MAEATKSETVTGVADSAGAAAAAAADPNLLSSPPKCWGCQKAIDGGSAIQFADGVWHIDCKVIEFDSNLLFLADGKPICPECSYCCSLCKKPIFDEAIVTVEGTYHSECFRCTNCKQRIQGKSFAKTSQGIIYCVACYSERRERKKAARRRREHQVVEEKSLPQLPQEAAKAAQAAKTTAAAEESRSSVPGSGAGSPNKNVVSPGNLQSAATSAMTSPPTASPAATVEAASAQKPAQARRRGMRQADDLPFGDAADTAATSDRQKRSSGKASASAASAPASPGSGGNSTAAATATAATEAISAPAETDAPALLRAQLTDADLEAGLAWTEDMGALEKNFVRYSMRAAEPGLKRGRALKRAASVGRGRAASSVSTSGSMVPPGLRSTGRTEANGGAWLRSASAAQLREELLVNYGQLCRMEASYQKLRDLYASVIDQLLETRENLQQERSKRTEYERILRSYYGYVPSDAPDNAQRPHRHQAQQQQLRRQASQRRQPLAPSQQQQQQQQPPPPSHSQNRRHRPEDDSASDAEDEIITTVPQKATKRFLWPFGGGSSNNNHSSGGPTDGSPQHSFHVAATLRASKCDHCQERLKTFSSTVVRCRGCGFVCHQRCVANVTAACTVAARGGDAAAAPTAETSGSPPIDSMFGRALAEQAAQEGGMVPWVVRAAVRFIEEEGLTMEGVYRRSGSTMDIRDVHAVIARVGTATNGQFSDSDATIAPDDTDVPSVTSILKEYLRNLPDPLMTTDTYTLWVDAANKSSSAERIHAYRTISALMPMAHAATLRFLMRHLKRIADHQHENKMTPNNLAVVFAPNILRMGKGDMLQEMANMSEINKTVSFLIQHVDEVWPDDSDLGGQQHEQGEQMVDGGLSLMQQHYGDMEAAVLSSPSSPTQMRFDDSAGNADLAVSALESMSLSHSMPSPSNQFFGFIQQQQSTQYSRRRDSNVYGKSSFDVSTK
ncbi:Rho-type gtpase-activating protein [Coemansia sp. RSA 2336]|nr:Rho-type gtpase-activating protein [Coemansia sp. RSA 2336]